MRWGEQKRVDTARKTGRGEGCLVLAEAAILSSGGQDRLKEAEETKKEKAGSQRGGKAETLTTKTHA